MPFPAPLPDPFGAIRRAAVALALLLLVGCAGDRPAPYADRPVGELYNLAQDLLDRGEFREAGRAFEEVERQHPYSQWAVRSQLMAAYAYYEANDYEEAIAAARRFIELHPGHPDTPYAQYLIGMSYYERISDVQRDQEMTEEATKAFEELIRRYPDTDYARDARLKLDLTRDHMAGKHMEIGRYYQKRGQYVAAINRFRTVVEQYQTTTHVPEALHRLTECYLALGVREEAQNAAAVLGYNFPGSPWYERAYALLQGQQLTPVRSSRSWLGGLF